MRIAKARSIAYRAARVAGDIRAIQTGRIGDRIIRRLFGRMVWWRIIRRIGR